MRSISCALLTGSLLIGGFLAVCNARAASLEWRDPAAKPGEPAGVLVRPPWSTPRVDLDILVDGQPLRTIAYAGKLYLPIPRWGTEYAIRIRNNGPRRIEAVVSVDGLSVVSGRPAAEEQRGYLVYPSDEIVIKGWRRNRDTVAAFSFQEREKSYASLMGRPENIGVIGLTTFDEAVVCPVPEREKADFAAPAGARRLSELGGTGTGYGRDVDSHVDYVPFIRGASRRTVTLYYDTADALRSAGVPVPGPYPRPFPGDPEFAPPPPGDARK
jgi:hypothetical protein